MSGRVGIIVIAEVDDPHDLGGLADFVRSALSGASFQVLAIGLEDDPEVLAATGMSVAQRLTLEGRSDGR